MLCKLFPENGKKSLPFAIHCSSSVGMKPEIVKLNFLRYIWNASVEKEKRIELSLNVMIRIITLDSVCIVYIENTSTELRIST